MTTSNQASTKDATNTIDRRRFIGRGAAALGGLALTPAFLAACGSDAAETSATGTSVASVKDVTPATSIRWSNWPAYLDLAEDNADGTSTLDDFIANSGIDVAYTEDVQDNETYFAKVREPLKAGQDIGADTFIVSNYMVGRLISLGYLAPMEMELIPNAAANLAFGPSPVDPDRAFSLPYFGGFVSIAYNKTLTGREITSIEDLFDPAFAGQVTMFSDLRDGLGLILVGMGVDLDSVTVEDIQAAADKVKAAKDSGQIRSFTGNDYIADLASGNTAIAMAYSGDVAQIQYDNPDIEFVVPTEGMQSFTDNWVVPASASPEAKAAVYKLIDYYYDPVNSAKITNWVQYISPVTGVGAELEKLDPEVSANPLINPPQEWLDASSDWRVLTDEEDVEYTTIFNAVIEG